MNVNKVSIEDIQVQGKRVLVPVSYTHLDVYKRQPRSYNRGIGAACFPSNPTPFFPVPHGTIF